MKCTECGKDFEPDCAQEEICKACQYEDVPEAHMRCASMIPDAQLLCECGHPKIWHVDDDDEHWTGHYCDYAGCKCLDFLPVTPEVDECRDQ